MSSATCCVRGGTWSGPTVLTIRRAACWRERPTGSYCICAGLPRPGWRWSAHSQMLPEPVHVRGQAAVLVRRFTYGGCPRGPHHAEAQVRVDRPGGQVGVPVTARGELVP